MTGDGEISIRVLGPGEAPSLISLIRACYGETYIEAAPKQIQRINVLEGDNARHVQALYRRAIDQ